MPTVLIVEEDMAFRKQLLEVFDHGNGFDAFAEAGNGVEALDKTKCLSPNLAILDLSLPDVGGIQLAQELMEIDRKSTRLNSSHQIISYAVFCLKKKTYKTSIDHDTCPQGNR